MGRSAHVRTSKIDHPLSGSGLERCQKRLTLWGSRLKLKTYGLRSVKKARTVRRGAAGGHAVYAPRAGTSDSSPSSSWAWWGGGHIPSVSHARSGWAWSAKQYVRQLHATSCQQAHSKAHAAAESMAARAAQRNDDGRTQEAYSCNLSKLTCTF
jgi:hypothetical protein